MKPRGREALMPAETEAWATDQADVLEVGTFRELPIRFRDELTSLAVINGKARGKVEFLSGEDVDEAFQVRGMRRRIGKFRESICSSADREALAANPSGHQGIRGMRNLQGFRPRSRDHSDAQNSL